MRTVTNDEWNSRPRPEIMSDLHTDSMVFLFGYYWICPYSKLKTIERFEVERKVSIWFLNTSNLQNLQIYIALSFSLIFRLKNHSKGTQNNSPKLSRTWLMERYRSGRDRKKGCNLVVIRILFYCLLEKNPLDLVGCYV